MDNRITEEYVVERIIDFMLKKENGNWHEEKVEKSDLHKHVTVIILFWQTISRGGLFFF